MSIPSTAPNRIFYLFARPTYAGFFDLPRNVKFIIRTSTISDQGPPPGYPFYAYNPTAVGGISNTGNIRESAKIVADYMEYYGYVRGSGMFGPSGMYDGAFWIQNIGIPIVGASGNPLLTNHLMDVVIPGAASSFYPSGIRNSGTFNTDYARMSPYHASGIADTRAWMQQFCTYLKAECDNRVPPLCYPAKYFEDFETYGSSWEALYNRNGYEEGFLRAALVDPRASTETIFEIPSGTGWAPFRLIDTSGNFSSYLTGGAAPTNTQPSLTEDSSSYLNRDWWPHFMGVCIASMDYAVYKALLETAQSYFPYIQVGNYQCSTANNKNYPIHFTPGVGDSGYIPISRGHFSQPVLYPPYLDYYPETPANTYIRVATEGLRSSFQSSGAHETVPWITSPGVSWNTPTGTYSPTSSDILAIISNFYDMGGLEMILFNYVSDGEETFNLVSAALQLNSPSSQVKHRRRF